MNEQDLLKLILEKSSLDNGVQKLSCESAHMIAESARVNLKEVGKLCMRESIKIVHCQLGCFGNGKH